MLMNDFYTIQYLQREPNSFSCKVAFNSGHDIFTDSHTQPVVPGICMMEMVKELLEQQTDKLLWMRDAALVKFLQMITPDVQPVVNVSWVQQGRGYTVNASIENNAADLFRLSGSFEAK